METTGIETTERESAATGAQEPILTWQVCLVREYPSRMLAVLPIVLVGLLVSIVLFRSALFTVVTLFLFLSSLAEFIFPIRYEIDGQGATARTILGKTRVEWDRVKKYYLDDHGIKLSTVGSRSRLEAYRGVYLRFGDRREEVVRVVRMMRDGHH